MIKAFQNIIRIHIQNYRLIIKIALINTKKQTVRSSIGILWTYIHDIVYALTFVAFRVLVSGYGNIQGMNSIVYLMTGLIPWFAMSDVLNQGSMAIRSNKGIVQSIKFPVPLLPTVEVLGIYIRRFFTFFILFILVSGFGYLRFFHLGLFLYYTLCSFLLMVGMNWILSAFVAVSEDFRQLHLAFMRIMVYMLPIMWTYEKIENTTISVLLKINPIAYIILGYRDAFVIGKMPWTWYSVYFWVVIICLFLIGSYIQFKLKKYYADFV